MKPKRKRRRAVRARRRRGRFTPNELVFQPWFLPRASRLAIDKLIPSGYRNKMRAYFEDYGCMLCGTQDGYDANGMCRPCHHLIRRRLRSSARRRLSARSGDELGLIMARRKSLASRLLAPFAQPRVKMPLRHRLRVGVSLRNPVDEALGFITPGSWTEQHRNSSDNQGGDFEYLGKSVSDMRPGRTSPNG